MTGFPPLVSRLIPRLATHHVGELVATRDALVRSLGTVGLDLHDLAAACTSPTSPTAVSTSSCRWSPAASGTPSFGDMARACRDLDCGHLELREKQFVSDMCRRGFGFRPSARQAGWLQNIFDRLNERAAA